MNAARQVALGFERGRAFHLLYAPDDRAKRPLPVIVEYLGNAFGSISSGRLEDCRMGRHITDAPCLWLVLPILQARNGPHLLHGWGDASTSAAYTLSAVEQACREHGGDPRAVFATGFSRGAIACGYVGLHDDDVARIWAGFILHSHHDVSPVGPPGGADRLRRIAGRPSFITYGEHDTGRAGSEAGATALRTMGFPVVERVIPRSTHSDEWITRDSPVRRELHAWMQTRIASVTQTQ